MNTLQHNPIQVSETWSGLRAGGGSRDGIRTIEAGYRAEARQTVTSCHAEQPVWDVMMSNGLKFAVNKCLNFISYESCLFPHVRELGDPTPGRLVPDLSTPEG